MTLTASQIALGIGLIVALAAGCQIAAAKLGIPGIVLLLPAGFVAGSLTTTVNPHEIFGDAFPTLVSLGVAIILFDGGLDLVFRELEGHSRLVVRRLLLWGIPVTWAGAAFFASMLLGLSSKVALMLGAILIVSGPTVVAPLLRASRPGPRLLSILGWESTTIDPIGAVVGVLVFQSLSAGAGRHFLAGAGELIVRVSFGIAAGTVGAGLLWLLLRKLSVSGTLATEAIVATVVAVAAACDAFRDDTGLVAAITMGVALANLPGLDLPEDRPFFQTIVQLTIGLLFVSISATVTPASLRGVFWPSVGLAACLMLVVRPVVTAVATVRTDLTRHERIFIGSMDPRGIIAASTATSFSGPLAAIGIAGADHLLPVTFLVIVVTVTLYGLVAVPLARGLGLSQPEPGEGADIGRL